MTNNATLAYTGATAASNRSATLGAGRGQIEVADAAATLTMSGIVGGSALSKTGPGALTLSDVNTYVGGMTFFEGELSISADTNLGAVPAMPAINLTFVGGALAATGGAISLALNRSVQLQAAGGTVDVAGGSTLTIPGRIDGPGTLTKTGPGTLALSAFNTYSGGVAITGGALRLSWDTDLGTWPNAPAVNITLDGGTLQTQTFVALHPNRTLRVEAAGGTIDVGSGGSLYVLGSVEVPGTLTKTGPGTMSLNGNGGGAAIIDEGAMGGTGAVAGGVTVNPGGHLAPGNSPGTLTVGFLSIVNGAVLDIELAGTANGQYDRLVVSGNAALGGTLNASLVGGFVPTLGDAFTVLTFDSRAGDFAS